MTAIVLLGLVSLAQPPQPAPIPATAPTEPAPLLQYVTQIEGQFQALEFQFKNPTQGFTGVLTAMHEPQINDRTPEVKIMDMDGKPVFYNDAAKKIAGGTIALVINWPATKVDAIYLQAVKDDTLLIVQKPPLPPTGPPVESLYPVPDTAPKTRAPALVYLTESKGTVQLLAQKWFEKMMTKKVEKKNDDGSTTEKDVHYKVLESVWVMEAMPEPSVKFTDVGGKAVAYADAVKKCKGGTVALSGSDGSRAKVDPQYTKAMKDGTLVIEFMLPVAPNAPRPLR